VRRRSCYGNTQDTLSGGGFASGQSVWFSIIRANMARSGQRSVRLPTRSAALEGAYRREASLDKAGAALKAWGDYVNAV